MLNIGERVSYRSPMAESLDRDETFFLNFFFLIFQGRIARNVLNENGKAIAKLSFGTFIAV
jgi:hypothetical protein